jgi:hypothetical protein
MIKHDDLEAAFAEMAKDQEALAEVSGMERTLSEGLEEDEMKRGKEISFSKTTAQTVPDFSYSMRGKVISITGLILAQTSSIKEIEKILRKTFSRVVA